MEITDAEECFDASWSFCVIEAISSLLNQMSPPVHRHKAVLLVSYGGVLSAFAADKS